jgi:hypothetical protein
MAAALTLGVAVISLIITAGGAGAVDQTNPDTPTVSCGGVWHWVHNQTEATSGVLTARFDVEGQGLVTITTNNGPPFEATNLHYEIELEGGATLISASDNVADGNLLLSHWPICGPATTGVTPSTSAETTTSSRVTSTTLEGTTTTEGAVTPTTPEETTTTIGGAVTPTSVEQTTTTEGAVTPTTPEETTTTIGGAVTPATVEQTSTTPAEAVTSSTRLEVLETTITAPGSTISATAETLPFTGFGWDETGGIAFALVAFGGLVVLSYGYRPGEGNRYRGRHRRPSRHSLQRIL